MVKLMKPGSIIVDLASQQGGNCELCKRDEITEFNGVKIIGYTDLPSRLASQSSELYANNLYHILDELTPKKDGVIDINKEDIEEVIKSESLQIIRKRIDEKINLKELVSRNDKYGKYAWSVISKIILYASSLIPNVTKDYNNIDEAMRLGFNWTKGPFEMLEELGVKFFVEKDSQLKINGQVVSFGKTTIG